MEAAGGGEAQRVCQAALHNKKGRRLCKRLPSATEVCVRETRARSVCVARTLCGFLVAMAMISSRRLCSDAFGNLTTFHSNLIETEWANRLEATCGIFKRRCGEDDEDGEFRLEEKGKRDYSDAEQHGCIVGGSRSEKAPRVQDGVSFISM